MQRTLNREWKELEVVGREAIVIYVERLLNIVTLKFNKLLYYFYKRKNIIFDYIINN